jgi:hypothetical protein
MLVIDRMLRSPARLFLISIAEGSPSKMGSCRRGRVIVPSARSVFFGSTRDAAALPASLKSALVKNRTGKRPAAATAGI